MAVGDTSNFNGLFKTVYGDKLVEAVPNFAILQKKVPFSEADKIGDHYEQPVALTHEAGFTYNGTLGAVVQLNAALQGVMKPAQVYGTEIILRSQMAYKAMAEAAEKGKRAFERLSAWKVEDMNNAARKRLEISLLYGQMSVGQLSANAAGQVLTTSAATWAGGIWAGAEGAVIDVYSATSASATLRDSGGLVISAIDSDARTLTVVGTCAASASGDYIYFKGARTTTAHNDMAGLQKIISNTGSLFNIDASAYSLWKGTAVSSVGQLTFSKLQDYVSRAVNKGLMEDVLVLVSPKAYSAMNSDQAGLRVFDQSYSSRKVENGSETLEFYGVNGKMELMSHPLVKDGDFFAIPLSAATRIGSTDVTFALPGKGDEFFQYIAGYNAVELQCMSDQAIFLDRPAHAVYGSGITFAS